MTIDDLIYNMNNKNLDDLLPISKVQTDSDVLNYKKQGYCTLPFSQFKEKFPDVKEEYIKHRYYDAPYSNEILYYDLDNMLLFSARIFIIDDKFDNFTVQNKSGNEKINILIQQFNSIYKDENFVDLYFMVPQVYQIEFFTKIFDKISDKLKYNLFLKCYCNADFGAYKLSVHTLNSIWHSKSQQQIIDTRNELDKLTSDDVLYVYRGIGDKSSSNGYSYTLNHDVARFFAFRHSKNAQTVAIVEGEVKKEDVIEYITHRDEDEIIALPDSINKKCYTEFHGINSFIDESILYTYALQKDFFLEVIEQLELKELEKGDHNDKHMLRVLILVIILAKEYKIKQQYIDTLYLAAMFHDIGRVNDDIDEHHGINSYHLPCQFDEQFKHNILLQNLMSYHCKPDKQALHDDCFKNDDEMLLYMILKDADALDRQRFDLRSLKIQYLRLDFSKDLLFAAYQLTNFKV